MKPTQGPPDLPAKPAVQPDSVPTQTFEALLARYKARVYEIYADQICAVEDEDRFTLPAGVDSPAPDPCEVG